MKKKKRPKSRVVGHKLVCPGCGHSEIRFAIDRYTCQACKFETSNLGGLALGPRDDNVGRLR